jgi:hypothetical protein
VIFVPEKPAVLLQSFSKDGICGGEKGKNAKDLSLDKHKRIQYTDMLHSADRRFGKTYRRNRGMYLRNNHSLTSRATYFAVAMMVILCLGCGPSDQRAADRKEFSDAIRVSQTGATKEIYLWEKQIDDEDIRQLAALTELHSLAIPHAKNVTNASMEVIARIPGLLNLDLAGASIDNEGLLPLRNHPTLTRLVLNESRVTDEGLVTVATIPNLNTLELYRCFITDEGCRHIGRMRNLVKISLDSTPVSDRGLIHFYPLENLRRLQVWDTNVTEEGKRAFERRMPNVEITR